MKKRHLQAIILFFLIMTLGLCGCAKDDALTEYRVKMDSFYDHMSQFGDAINSLDPQEASSVNDMLHYLNSIAALVHEMAAYDVPEVFVGVKDLAEQADLYMSDAVSLFHEAYEAAVFNEHIADAAYEHYERANLRLHYIAEILRGDIPEEIFEPVNDEQ